MGFPSWRHSALGRRINVDKAYGDQCVDVDMDYVQYLWHKPWSIILGHGNAKDLFYTASPSYFKKTTNNPHDAKQIPKQGDVVVIGAFSGNPFGHTYVADSTNHVGANCIEQDGFNPNGKCYEKFRGYTVLPIIGWMTPRTSLFAKVAQKVKPKKPVVPTHYTVHAGDNLTAIASHFHTTVAALAKLNHISNPDKIKVGQVLKLR